MSPPIPRVRCRQIAEADLEAVADLLTRGFPERSRKYWATGLARLQARPRFEGCPSFGYLLEADGAVVGVLLLLFSTVSAGEAVSIRCNVSSWYVEPDYRQGAAMLVSAALKLKHVTYVNLSAAPHTWPILLAQGYRRFSEGQFAAIPLLGRRREVSAFRSGDKIPDDLPEADMLRAHVEAGCLAVVCQTPEGPAPFLFLRRRLAKLPFGVAQLIYCRDTADYVRCAGPLGRWLLARGVLLVLCAADGPLAGLVGRFFKHKQPGYYRGPHRPRANDLTFTEAVLFGP